MREIGGALLKNAKEEEFHLLNEFSEEFLFTSPCGSFQLQLIGVVENFSDFIDELEESGVSFLLKNQGEVIIHFFKQNGFAHLSRFKGNFAFAFWDKTSGSLVMGRSRFSTHRIFWSINENGLVFTSELNSLFRQGVKKDIAQEHLDELFFYRHVSGTNTIYKDIFRVPHGQVLEIKSGGEIAYHEIERGGDSEFSVSKESSVLTDMKSLKDPEKESRIDLFDWICQAIEQNPEPMIDYSVGLKWVKNSLDKEDPNLEIKLKKDFFSEVTPESIFGNSLQSLFFHSLKCFPENWFESYQFKRMKRYLSFSNTDFQLLTYFNYWYLADLRKLGLRSLNVLTENRIQLLEKSKNLYPGSRVDQLNYLSLNLLSQAKSEELFLLKERMKNEVDLSIGENGANEINWTFYFLNHPGFTAHLDSLPDNGLFQIGWLRYLDVPKLIQEFKKDPESTIDLILPLYFNSLWFNIHFSS